MEDSTKYPWNKSIFGKNSKKLECVYAGPEQMPRFDEEHAPVTKPVYAAPAGGKSRKRINNSSQMEGVYAGPDAFNDVYAGPEFFERPADALDEEPEDIPVPEEAPVKPPQQVFMVTYAGPQYFNNNQGGAGMFFAPGAPVCKNCGAILKPEYKFCTECGTPVVKNEQSC